MNSEELKKLSNSIDTAIQEYELLFPGLKFKEFEDLFLTPEKGYSAKTSIPVEYQSKFSGNLVVLLFNPGDGTGSESEEYNSKNLAIPPSLQYKNKPWKVIPRSKEGIIFEGCFPLFSIQENSDPIYFLSSLNELTLTYGGNTILATHTIGLDLDNFSKTIENKINIKPIVYLTTINIENNKFGDPHSIHYYQDEILAEFNSNAPKIRQMVGFLAITEKTNPLLKIVNQWRFPDSV